MISRISNLNSFSAVIDRIIIENLKLLKFVDDNNKEKIITQENVINGLHKELSDILDEVYNGDYHSLDENRTYAAKSNELLEDIFKLCTCNYIIGKLDKKKIYAAEHSNISSKRMRSYILQVRDYLEFRSYIKNKLEKDITVL
jgi:hypothetical protein